MQLCRCCVSEEASEQRDSNAPDLAPWLHELTRHREYFALWGLLEELLLNPPPDAKFRRCWSRGSSPGLSTHLAGGEQTGAPLDPILLPCSFPLPGIRGSTRAGCLTCKTSCSINVTPGGAPRSVSLCWWGGDGVTTSRVWFLPVAVLMLELLETLRGCSGEPLQQLMEPGKFCSSASEASRRCPAGALCAALPLLPREVVPVQGGSHILAALPMIHDPAWVETPRLEQNK